MLWYLVLILFCQALRAAFLRSIQDSFIYQYLFFVMCGFLHLKFTRLHDFTLLLWGCAVQILNFLHNFHTRQDLSKDDVLAVQPAGLHSGDKELTAVGVPAGVSHGQQAGNSMLQLEVFVVKLLTVDGLAPGTVASGKVPTLDHEVLDHTMKSRAFIAKTLLSSSKRAEVFSGLWHSLAEQTKGDALRLTATDRDIEIHFVCDFRALLRTDH
mmetsp:Transcript_10028/g.11699  ORF Transcript_10028/g.11699 Transcript_10028/m.11699 type:complete len:212 (+) Transcript_10028:124-759(+)